ncbi:hypothetical protein CPB86DRAFT_787564 [Serendipita vermifera]|nr:hypothetical protein CPB86DRAFT_787564 [Serendipita vermifera]
MEHDSTSNSSGRRRSRRRRSLSIEYSGQTPQNTPSMNITTTVPLNSGGSFNLPTSILNYAITIPHTTLVARPYALGGGEGHRIASGKFEGRVVGRGTRNEVYGTARYGSGFGSYTRVEATGAYAYQADLRLNMTGRNEFPHGFPPISWGTYGGVVDPLEQTSHKEDYPGLTDAPYVPHGPQATRRLQAILAKNNGQEWFVAADGATMRVLNDVLGLPREQGGCGIEPTTPLSLNEAFAALTSPRTIPEDITWYYSGDGLVPDQVYSMYPWNVVQYYRGCSVILGSKNYDNQYAHGDNLNATDYWASTPLNTTSVDMEFLQCLNTTIAAVVPIIDPALVAVDKPQFVAGQLMGIVLGCLAGGGLLLYGTWYLYRRYRCLKEQALPLTEHGRLKTTTRRRDSWSTGTTL